MKRVLLFCVVLGLAAWKLGPELGGGPEKGRAGKAAPAVAVEAEPIRSGPISLRRTFSGAVESCSRFVVAPKVSGRLEFLAVDIGDRVRRGQLVARLDHDEFSQAVTQARADLAVARAGETQAKNSLDIAVRELRRMETLRKRGISSEAQLDAARSRQMTAQSGLEIARAQVTRAVASLETARIRLGYTDVTADWSGADEWRVVAEKLAAEGDMVAANSPLVSIIDLDPVTGVMFITEKDYGRLEPGQQADLTADAFPDRIFSGKISRIAPVFREATRQARVELTVENPDQALKPGMFIRVGLVLDRADPAVIVPESALTVRDGKTGLFLIQEADRTVTWQEVTTGIREGDQVQVNGISPGGRVVTLGQQLLDQGSRIVIAGEEKP